MRSQFRGLFLCLAGFAFMMLAAAAQAQTAAPAVEPPPEKVRELLQLLNDPGVKAWLETRPAPAAEAPEETFGTRIAGAEAAVRARIAGMRSALPRLPQEVAQASAVAFRDVNAGRPGAVMAILATLVAFGAGAEWLFRRVVLGGRQAAAAQGDGDERPLRLLSEFIPLVVFALASAGLFLLFDWPPLMRLFVLTLLSAVIAFRVVRTVCGLLLRPPGRFPGSSTERLLVLDDRQATFWFSRLQLFAGIFLFGWALVSLMPHLGFTVDARRLIAYTLGLGLLAVAIDIAWRRPAVEHGVARRARSWLTTFYLILLWLIWVSGMNGLLWIGIYALALPQTVRGVGRVAARLFGDNRSEGLMRALLDVLIVRGARAAAIGLAMAWLTYILRETSTVIGRSAVVERFVEGVFHGILVLLIADLVWQLSKTAIEHRLQTAGHGESADEIARSGRLRTLLPIFKNALAVFILVVAALTVLSGLGVQIMPLIAGAGIFGVAIGFGSQTLVKDVLSGVFYMLDDAFRVGEYIQSGSYKGTVESFSLRSVRLRHHRGPVFTVPFGDLGAVQNMSRDWVMEKIVMTVTYDFDVELARKLIKKIGQELAEDPEFKASTIQPLKMQGVDSFGESGIVLRMKLMTKPGEQFGIKRKAFVMIKKAFDDNGIKLAVPTVQVSGGEDHAPAAADAVRRRTKAAKEQAAAAE